MQSSRLKPFFYKETLLMCIWAEFSQLQPADVGVVVHLDFSRHLQSDHP